MEHKEAYNIGDTTGITSTEMTHTMNLEVAATTVNQLNNQSGIFNAKERLAAFHRLVLTALTALLLGVYSLLASASAVITPTVYPSTSTAWVIPGYHAAVFDPLGFPISTKAELIDWELNHADIAFGSNYDKSAGEEIINLGYIYIQKIDFSPGSLEFFLMEYAERVNDNYEDYFLHFSEDTSIKILNPLHSKNTPLNRRPWIAGWTSSEVHSGFLVWQLPPYELQPFRDSEQGGCVFIYMPERFDQLEFNLDTVATTGRLLVQYPSNIDAITGEVNEWSIIESDIIDGTNGLRNSGVLSWSPPSNWVKAATYDPISKTGQFFGNKYLKEGQESYLVKVCRVDEDVNDQPIVNDMLIKDFMPYIDGSDQVRLIPGWDSANDMNGDGYVDAIEFNNLMNPAASARFRYESRVTPLGNMWSANSNFQRPDLFNPSYRAAIASFTKQEWIKNGLIGAYNDDVFKLDTINITDSKVGGEVAEHSIMINDPTFKEAYQKAFLDTLREIKIETQSPWVAANISAENLFSLKNNKMEYVDVFDTFLREDYIRPGMGLDGYFGIAKMWENFALTFNNKKIVIMAHAAWAGGTIPTVNTKAAWEARIATGLAMYYLVNVPGLTSYTSWSSSFNYGSDNTVIGNFYKAGVPKNIAYQPSLMLAVDIGAPTQSIQRWSDQSAQPLIYTAKTGVDDYAVIGDSTQSVLTHPGIAEFFQQGSVEVTPSNIYYAWQSDKKIRIGGIDYPKQMIIARDYSNGLVLYQTDFFGGSLGFMSVTNELTLPDEYHRVNYDGTLQPASNTISLTGYEGIVLMKPEKTPPSDMTPPIITLVGSNPQTITVGTAYTELGATATDDVDGDITAVMSDAAAVNVDVTGSYIVIYSVVDGADNMAQATRTVNVIAAEGDDLGDSDGGVLGGLFAAGLLLLTIHRRRQGMLAGVK